MCRSLIAVLTLLVGLSGCALPLGRGGQMPGPGGITPGRPGAATAGPGVVLLHASARELGPGLPVRLLLVNRSTHLVYFNPCNAQLERHTDGRWEVGEGVGGVTCAPLTVPVPGNSFARHEVGLPAGLGEGRYRFRLELDGDGPAGRPTVLSNGFRIR